MLNRFKTMAATAAAVTALCIGCGDMDRDFYQHTLEISESPIGSGTVSREPNKASYRDGETVTVTATAKSGYSFVSWTGALNATTPSVTFTINSDLRLTANFERQGVTPPDSSVNPPDTTRPPEVNGVVGDWLAFGDDVTWTTVFSLKSNGQMILREFEHIGDFWIEELSEIAWRTSGDTLYYIVDVGSEWEQEIEFTYSVSGDTLIFGQNGDENRSGGLIRINLETFRTSLGQVYSLNPVLRGTWYRNGNEHIHFDHTAFVDYDYIYISGTGQGYYHWRCYTEGSQLFLVNWKCNNDGENCAVAQTVTLDYELSNDNKTLRLRPTGSNGNWDVWTQELYKSKTGPEKSKRAASPFQALRR